jgi:hypothetical protein
MNLDEECQADRGTGYGLLCKALTKRGEPLPHEGMSREVLVQQMKIRLEELKLSFDRACEQGVDKVWLRLQYGLKKLIKCLENPIVCNGKGRFQLCECPQFEMAEDHDYFQVTRDQVCEFCLEQYPAQREKRGISTRILRSTIIRPAICRCAACLLHKGEFHYQCNVACRCNVIPYGDVKLEKLCHACIIDCAVSRYVKWI